MQYQTKNKLELSLRQRAMLSEMGIHVWLPKHESASKTNKPLQAKTTHNKISSQSVKPKKQKETPVVVDKTLICQECAPYTNTSQNIELLSVDKAKPRWLFVLDSITQDTTNESRSNQKKIQQLLRNMMAALRLQEQQAHQCHACSCFRIALQNKDQQQPAKCSAWLLHEIMRIQPQVIVALGRQAAFSLLGSTAPLGSLRNTTHHIAVQSSDNYPEWILQIPVLVSYPLDYLLRTPAAKARAWQDLCQAHSLVQTIN